MPWAASFSRLILWKIVSSGAMLFEKHHTLGVSLKDWDAVFKEAGKRKMMERERVMRVTETKTEV